MGSLRKLIEDVHGSPIDDKAFNTFRDYLVLFRLPAIIRQVKDEFKIDTGKSFKQRTHEESLESLSFSKNQRLLLSLCVLVLAHRAPG